MFEQNRELWKSLPGDNDKEKKLKSVEVGVALITDPNTILLREFGDNDIANIN